MFLDLGALPWGPGAKKYWEWWRTPHVFFCQGVDNNTVGTRAGPPTPLCPPEWALRSVTLSHCDAGGATSGRWTVVVWYIPLLPFSEPLLAVPQAWFPLFCYVRDRESAVHHPTLPSRGIAVPYVVRSEGLVQDWGLFPASDLEAQALVQCSPSPSGYGSWRLTWLELGGLWDLPISIMDALPPASSELMLRAFCKTAPTKVLLVGRICC